MPNIYQPEYKNPCSPIRRQEAQAAKKNMRFGGPILSFHVYYNAAGIRK